MICTENGEAITSPASQAHTNSITKEGKNNLAWAVVELLDWHELLAQIAPRPLLLLRLRLRLAPNVEPHLPHRGPGQYLMATIAHRWYVVKTEKLSIESREGAKAQRAQTYDEQDWAGPISWFQHLALLAECPDNEWTSQSIIQLALQLLYPS